MYKRYFCILLHKSLLCIHSRHPLFWNAVTFCPVFSVPHSNYKVTCFLQYSVCFYRMRVRFQIYFSQILQVFPLFSLPLLSNTEILIFLPPENSQLKKPPPN